MALLAVLAVVLPGSAAVAGDRTGQDYDIVQGRPADIAPYPGMTAILVSDEAGGVAQFCGGTLIDPGWVLTAAHCFYDDRTGGANPTAEQTVVVVGAQDWTDGSQGEEIPVAEIVLHPSYEPIATVNDIALLRLAGTSTAPPQRVVQTGEEGLWTSGTNGRVIGYGATSSGGPASTSLLETDVPLLDDASCSGIYSGYDDLRHLCAGAPSTDPDNPGPDSCQGDSGGPLFTQPPEGGWVQVGVVSFGNGCGYPDPGVYTQLASYLDWIANAVGGGGGVDPDNPDPVDEDPIRIETGEAISDPASQAGATSLAVFDDLSAEFAVLARSDLFPDALGGSSLAFGVAPLLFTDATGTLPERTVQELLRVVQPGGVVYVLGGAAAVPPGVDAELQGYGFQPVRLAGSGREATAGLVAEEVISQFGFDDDGDGLPDGPALDTMIVATGGNWPDAVAAGQLGSWWGMPILLTPTDFLHPEAEAALARYRPGTVYVIGGTGVVSDAVAGAIQATTGGEVIRLGGATRTGTSASVFEEQLALFDEVEGGAPQYAVTVNLRRADAFAHVLSASMVTGRFRGAFVAVEGESGDIFTPDMAAAICGTQLPQIVQGGPDLVDPGAVAQVQLALDGEAC